MRTDDVEGRLADFALGTEWGQVPAPVQDRVLDLVLDAFACGLTGRVASGRDAFASAARAVFGDGGGRVPVIDGGYHAPAVATMLNGWQITATTMCDVYRPAMCHITPVVIPAALAALGRRSTRDEFLGSIAVAMEVMVRLCSAMDPEAYLGTRWHAPGVIGPYGSATAVARMRGLDPTVLRRAWGLAGLQSAGTFSAIGSPGVKFTQARAALAGVVAAEFAAAGHGGSDRVLAHPDGGLFDAYGGGDPPQAITGLGTDWRLLDISLRRWPAASSLQTVVDSVLALSDQDPADPDAIEIALPPMSYRLCATPGWESELSALQSARWVAAVVWTDRDCWTDQFTAERRADRAVAALASRVRVIEDPALRPGAAEVTSVRNRVSRTEYREHMPGAPERPLSRPEIVAKLIRATREDRAARLIALFDEWSADGLCDALAGDGS